MIRRFLFGQEAHMQEEKAIPLNKEVAKETSNPKIKKITGAVYDKNESVWKI